MTLYIAESNDRVRESLASLAACVGGINIVGEAGGVHEAVGGIKRAKPDSVIVALQMSGGSGLDVLAAARLTNPDTTIIVLTDDQRLEWKLKCFALGADFFFDKSSDVKKIVTTLVLLAHQPSRQRSLTDREDKRHALDPLSTPPSTSADNLEVLSARTLKAHALITSESDPQTNSKVFLARNPADSARLPPLAGNP